MMVMEKSNPLVQLLVAVLVQTSLVHSILHIPVGKHQSALGQREGASERDETSHRRDLCVLGLMFNGNQQNIYGRINPFARQYVLNKLERRFQYNVTELIDTLDLNDTDIDTWSSLCSQLSNGIMTVIGQVNHEDFDWLSGFCSAYQVPFLGLNTRNNLDNNYYISVMPDILPALLAFLRRYQINQLAYIYDDNAGAYRLKQLMEMQTANKIHNLNIISRYLGNPEDSYDLLQNIEHMTNTPPRYSPITSSYSRLPGRYVVLDFHSLETYRIVMDKIKHRGMTTADYHYIILSLNAKQLDMTYFRYGGVNVTFFALPSDLNIADNQTLALYETYVNATKASNAKTGPLVESLLMADAWETLLRTINRMLSSANETRDKLKVFRQGKFYNGLTPGIDCRNSHIQPWSAGQIYLENLLSTTFHGLTGNVQFSNTTGERVNYTLDVYRVTGNAMPKQIGFFHTPNTLEVCFVSMIGGGRTEV